MGERRVDPLKPGARAIQGLRAGVVTRTVAGAIDYALVVVATVGTYLGISAVMFLFNPISFDFPDWPFFVFLLIGFGYLVLYLWLAFATTGRTLGARIMGVRVVGFRGGRMRWIPALLRALFVAAFPVGLFWAALSRENRSLQDTVLRTSVIHDWPLPKDEIAITDADLKRID
jgi:uncharacterized RDD family membrane protein YckC